MSNNYIVCHARKVKTAVGLANVTTHNGRLNIYADTGEVLDKPEWLTNLDKAEYNDGPRHTPELILKGEIRRLKRLKNTLLKKVLNGVNRKKMRRTLLSFRFLQLLSGLKIKNLMKLKLI